MAAVVLLSKELDEVDALMCFARCTANVMWLLVVVSSFTNMLMLGAAAVYMICSKVGYEVESISFMSVVELTMSLNCACHWQCVVVLIQATLAERQRWLQMKY